MMESTLWRISKVIWFLVAVHVIRSLVKDGIYIAYLDGCTSYRRPYNVCGLEHYLLLRKCFIKRVNKHFKDITESVTDYYRYMPKKIVIYYMTILGYTCLLLFMMMQLYIITF
jgi:hypothetical protein